LIQQLSRFLSVFAFKNDIFFKENLPFIIVNDLYFKIDHIFQLKRSGVSHLTEVQNTISFLRKYNINPNLVIDLGACWGEYSLLTFFLLIMKNNLISTSF